jgi:hypothetical protein
MRESRTSGSVEGVMGNHDSYSDYRCWWRAVHGLPVLPALRARLTRLVGRTRRTSAWSGAAIRGRRDPPLVSPVLARDDARQVGLSGRKRQAQRGTPRVLDPWHCGGGAIWPGTPRHRPGPALPILIDVTSAKPYAVPAASDACRTGAADPLAYLPAGPRSEPSRSY